MNRSQEKYVAQLLKKYRTYKSNIEWHIKTNKPTGEEFVKCEQRVNDYSEVIADLEALASPKTAKP